MIRLNQKLLINLWMRNKKYKSNVSQRWTFLMKFVVQNKWSFSCVENKIACPAGKYLPGNSSTCSSCPSWSYCAWWSWSKSSSDQWKTACSNLWSNYTSNANAKKNTDCYISVSANKYKNSPTGNSTTNCPTNTYNDQHNSYYNTSDSCRYHVIYHCESCPSGFCNSHGGAYTDNKFTTFIDNSKPVTDCRWKSPSYMTNSNGLRYEVAPMLSCTYWKENISDQQSVTNKTTHTINCTAKS